MHDIVSKSILSPQNGMNLYRGCQHGCIYCDSRSLCYRMNHRFEDVAVKKNGVELLELALKRKRRPCMIATGTMSDPYTPIEAELKVTRRALEVIEKYGCGAAILTKSDLILRDLDILRRINRRSKAVVQLSLTSMDDRLSRLIEPNVCPTSRRIEVLKEFQRAGIPTVVWLCPILPYINDTGANIEGILESCIEAGVSGILCFNMGVTLREGNREYFYTQLDRHFPGMRERYIRSFGNAYELNSHRNGELMRLYHKICEKAGMMHDPREIFTYLHTFEEKGNAGQISFFD